MNKCDDVVVLQQVSLQRRGTLIFQDVDLQVPRGKLVVIMGPSGAGKSTLLNLITGQLVADTGSVTVFGQDINHLSSAALYALRKNMGMLYQNNALFTNISVYENVAFALREHTRLPESIIRDVVKIKLETVGLRGAIDLMPSELSGGMARRVALARAIAFDPNLILYDEPFTGLDPITMAVIVQLIRHIHDALNMTTIIVSHDVPETARIADYIYLLAEKKIIAQGEPEQLLQSEDPWVKQFMHGLPDGVVPFHYPTKDYAEDLLS